MRICEKQKNRVLEIHRHFVKICLCERCNKETEQLRARQHKGMWDNQTNGGVPALPVEENNDLVLLTKGTNNFGIICIRIMS